MYNNLCGLKWLCINFFNGEYFYSSNTLSFQENYHTWLQVLNGALINTPISPHLKLLWEMRSETWLNTEDTSQRLKGEGTQKVLVTLLHGGHPPWTLKPSLSAIALAEPELMLSPEQQLARQHVPLLRTSRTARRNSPAPCLTGWVLLSPLPSACGRQAAHLSREHGWELGLKPLAPHARTQGRAAPPPCAESLAEPRHRAKAPAAAVPRQERRRKTRLTNTSQSCFGLGQLLQA